MVVLISCNNGWFLKYFYFKIYQNNIFFYFLKIIFNISILLHSEHSKSIHILGEKQPILGIARRIQGSWQTHIILDHEHTTSIYHFEKYLFISFHYTVLVGLYQCSEIIFIFTFNVVERQSQKTTLIILINSSWNH
jgi:hypothetical protein